jgi:hypothetical protein
MFLGWDEKRKQGEKAGKAAGVLAYYVTTWELFAFSFLNIY